MASGFLTLFATPFKLSYVTAISPIHSSFLMVSETKIVRLTGSSVFRKEEMKVMLKRYVSIACVTCSAALAFAGPASAENVAIDATGAGSTQSVVVDSTSKISLTNTNTVKVTNVNDQKAATGDEIANSNTSVGGAASGGGSNANLAST